MKNKNEEYFFFLKKLASTERRKEKMRETLIYIKAGNFNKISNNF